MMMLDSILSPQLRHNTIRMHTFNLPTIQQDKSAIYHSILPQIENIIADEPNLIANLANITSILKETFGWFWVGFYLADLQSTQLILAPFQGTLACTRIAYGRGVCGQAWAKNETIIVQDVNQYPDHIACSSLSQSEIVVPLIRSDGLCVGVLDIDDDKLASFDEIDAQYLNKLTQIICTHHFDDFQPAS